MNKPSLTKSIFNIHCPSCREGKMFEGSAYTFKMNAFDMNKFCPKCKQNLEPEPGFYFGSMFISYGLTAWFSIFFVMIFHWLLDWGLYSSFALLILFLGINFIWIYRFSRGLWAHIAIKYGAFKAREN